MMPPATFADLLPAARPLLMLAPMQDVTDLAFMRVMHRYGGPDVYVTEYFRVHPVSRPEKTILRSIDENPTGRPVFAQMIGQELPRLVWTAQELERHPVAGIDLNLGCPAPVVCRKDSGGGLLRNPAKIDALLGGLREGVSDLFTVKTRIGFDAPEEFDAVLDVFARHRIDALTVHGRTVREMYRTAVHLDRIAQAKARLSCPVIANGNVLSVRLARETLDATGADGLMIGRGAIRNPWLFRQIREAFANAAAGRGFVADFHPTLRDIRAYLDVLWTETSVPGRTPLRQVAKMKKYLNFIGQGIGEGDGFLKEVRRAQTEADFWRHCDHWLDRADPFPDEPPVRALIDARSERTDSAPHGAAPSHAHPLA